MPYFKYVAKNEHHETVKGKVEARNKSQAAALLARRGLLVIQLHPFGEDTLALIKAKLIGIKHGDLVNFTRQLSTMINAGLPLANSLAILVEQSKTQMARLIADLLKEIEGGNAFSVALAEHKKTFSRVYIQLVKAGELGGVLDEVLLRLAETMEKEKEFRAKTKSAMIYPIIVVLAMIGVGFVMMIFVVPKLTDMYDDFGAELPLATKILIGISNLLVKFWWLLLFGVGGLGLLFKRWYQTRTGEVLIDTYLFKIPIIGELRKKIILTEFARTLALLLSAGVSLLEALDIVAQAMSSIIYREALQEATERVEKGQALSHAIASHDIFPPILHQMIAVGEETGKLDEVLQKLSSYFESESEHAVKNLTTALEPMIMIVLALGVGLMVIAIIMPIYNLTSQF
ncbi:MAG: hypothetical protein GF390_03370 [Candidatus Pacebacteria bacterium]|nr:hypothetical protein [Candidatus Paceibacterota bacterium]